LEAVNSLNSGNSSFFISSAIGGFVLSTCLDTYFPPQEYEKNSAATANSTNMILMFDFIFNLLFIIVPSNLSTETPQ